MQQNRGKNAATKQQSRGNHAENTQQLAQK
jgi:hypothetical protein